MIRPDKALRRLPIIVLLLLLSSLGLLALRSYEDINRTVTFDARINNLPVKTYQRVEVGSNTFVTGLEGQVSWKPKSFKEAFLINSIIDTRAAMGLFDILYLFIVNCIFFWMVYNIKIEELFSEKILTGTYIIAIMVVLYGGMQIMQHSLSDHFVNEITNGQFRAQHQGHISLIPYLTVMIFFFQAIPIFIRRARKIQQEQKYTI